MPPRQLSSKHAPTSHDVRADTIVIYDSSGEQQPTPQPGPKKMPFDMGMLIGKRSALAVDSSDEDSTLKNPPLGRQTPFPVATKNNPAVGPMLGREGMGTGSLNVK